MANATKRITETPAVLAMLYGATGLALERRVVIPRPAALGRPGPAPYPRQDRPAPPGEVFATELVRPVIALGTRGLLLGIKQRVKRPLRTAPAQPEPAAEIG